MSKCQYLHYEFGDTKGLCRYYPNDCPFGRCKFIRFKAAEVKPEPVKIQEPVFVPQDSRSKYDWDTVIPIMQEMRDDGKGWEEIAEATGVPRQSLWNKWKHEGMTIQKG